MSIPSSADVVVIGGGPAGSTFASLAAKYAPSTRVVVLEKELFPRHKVGESTIPVIRGVMNELGLADKLDASRFVKKVGVSFVWGQNRTPWNADYLSIAHINMGEDTVLDVAGTVASDLLKNRDFAVAWNVHRAEFDQILLDRSRELGADVHYQVRATEALKGVDGRISAVRWEDAQGRQGCIDTPFVLDASGLWSVLNRNNRDYDETMNNYAVHGYFSGANWKVTVRNNAEASTVFICACEIGWIWFIPISKDCVSVGLVTNRHLFKEELKKKKPDQLYRDAVYGCSEISFLLKDAVLRDDILPNRARVATCQDWSSWARNPVGPGWACAGDAAVFVDPILSTGVTLAVQSAHRAAYTWNTIRKGEGAVSESSLWGAYEMYLRAEYGAYVKLARTFYGNNRVADSWWWSAQRALNSSAALKVTDRDAFTLATAGFIPATRAIPWGVVVPMLGGIAGNQPVMENVLRERGLPSHPELMKCSIVHKTKFKLVERAEATGRSGVLDVYHDIISEDQSYAHRTFIPTGADESYANPARFDASFGPLVNALQEQRTVNDFVQRASTTLPELDGSLAAGAALGLVCTAALKGFIELVPG